MVGQGQRRQLTKRRNRLWQGVRRPRGFDLGAWLTRPLAPGELPETHPDHLPFPPFQRRLQRWSHSTRENARRMRVILGRLREPAFPAAGLCGEPFSEKSPEALRLLTLNMAHGRSELAHQALLHRRQVERHLYGIAATVRGLDVDVLALQEADGPSAWSGNFDHVAALAAGAELGAFFRGDHNPFGFGQRLNVASGTALLARLPLHDRRSHPFKSNWRDTKGFVVATVAVPEWDGIEIDVVSLHLDFLRPRIRRKQIRGLADALEPRRRPRVVLGDLNCSLHLEPRSMRLLLDTLDLSAWAPHRLAPTYPSARPRFRLDWILISRELKYGAYRTVDTRLSDHLGVVADLYLR